MNWLQFLREHQHHSEQSDLLRERQLASIRRQYAALSAKIEWHLGGNHLLENILALSICAAFLGRAKDLKRWLRLLRQASVDQYSPSGEHFERSIMYHCILLFRWLDFYSWLPTMEPLGEGNWEDFQHLLQQQLIWLQAMVTPTGQYPHFNDSTDGIAPSVMTLLAYANSLGIVSSEQTIDSKHFMTPSRVEDDERGEKSVLSNGKRSGEVNEPGYYRFRNDKADLWIDAAPIGPDHIPGHAHADNLTFVLHLNGHPLVVDTGISTYEKNARRQWERSTAAHNTVTVEGGDSSEIWGGFRVGSRARTQVLRADENTLVASHNGYGLAHRRRFELKDQCLFLQDDIGARNGVARLHFHEQHTLSLADGKLLGQGFHIRWSGGEATLKKYERGQGFNSCVPASVLKISFTKNLAVWVEWE